MTSSEPTKEETTYENPQQIAKKRNIQMKEINNNCIHLLCIILSSNSSGYHTPSKVIFNEELKGYHEDIMSSSLPLVFGYF